MKALYFDKELKLLDNVSIPRKPDEALIRITMAGVCNTDLEIIKGYMGFKGILGHEFIGIVEESNNKDFIGKRVCGEINCPCGNCYFCKNNMPTHCPNRTVLGIFNRDGVFCEYTTLPEKNLYVLEDYIEDEVAVFVEPIAAAYEILEQISIKPTDNIIILGDGKLGLLIAKVISLFTKNLLVVGKHENKLNILKNTGINTKLLDQIDNLTANIIIESTGSPQGISLALNTVCPRGTIVLKTTIADNFNINLSKAVINEINIIGSRCGPFKPAIKALKNNLIDVKPLITEIFDFDNAIEAVKKAQQKDSLKVLLRL